MRKLTLLAAGLIVLCVGSLSAAPVFPAIQCDTVPGAIVASPRHISFLYGTWTAPGFQCGLGDKLFSDFATSSPTDITMDLILEGTAPNDVHTINFSGPLETAFTVSFTITTDPTSLERIKMTTTDVSNPGHAGNPSITETVTAPGGFTGSTTASFLGGPGTAVLVVPPATSLRATDAYTPNGGAATQFGNAFTGTPTPTGGPRIANYQLVSQVDGPLMQQTLTFRADFVNPGPALPSVTATVTSLDPFHIRVFPGQGTLNFGPVPQISQVTSSNTFTIIVDSSVPLDFSKLQWTF